MSRVAFWVSVLALLAFLSVEGTTRAAPDRASDARSSPLELLVFEHPDCQYCRVFRRDVLPRYQEATSAASAPIRFIDIERTEIAGLRLRGGLHMVPTFVLMQDGREVDRIVGYWAPDTFFKMLNLMIARTDAAP